MRVRSVCKGGKYILPFKRHFITELHHEFPDAGYYVKWWIFAGLILLFAACDDACTTCCVVGKCYFLNLWVTAFYWFVDQLSWLDQRTLSFQRRWWLKVNTYVNLHHFFRNLLLWARLTHLYSVVLYSMKLKIMCIMIFTNIKEAGFLVSISMFAKRIEINCVTLVLCTLDTREYAEVTDEIKGMQGQRCSCIKSKTVTLK